MNDKEIQKLREWYQDYAGEDYDIILDFNESIDDTLTYSENLNILKNKVDELLGTKETLKNLKNEQEEYKQQEVNYWNKVTYKREILKRGILNEFRTIAIFGDAGSGKTAIAYKILEQFKGKEIYFIKHPKPEMIRKMGYRNLNNLEQLERLHDCIIYYDEPQLTTSIFDNKTNMIIARLCSLARQRNIKLIISSSDTRVFTKHNESYFDLWIIKDVDFSMVKNGSKIKKAIKDNATLDASGFNLKRNEFLVENRKNPELNGKYNFELPECWREELSTPYKNSE